MSDELLVQNLYPSNIYLIKKLEFLDIARQVSYDFLKKTKSMKQDIDSSYPVNTTDYMDDARIYPLIEYITGTGHQILQSQGFDMSDFFVMCKEFWCQEHEKHSGHNEHVHGFDFQLTGMYFLDVPEDSCELVIYDPRSAKRQINMKESNIDKLSYASLETRFKPVPGMLCFTNSWLPHGFTRNKNNKPFRFIHFNLGLINSQFVAPTSNATVI
jgi:hypothetical protein